MQPTKKFKLLTQNGHKAPIRVWMLQPKPLVPLDEEILLGNWVSVVRQPFPFRMLSFRLGFLHRQMPRRRRTRCSQFIIAVTPLSDLAEHKLLCSLSGDDRDLITDRTITDLNSPSDSWLHASYDKATTCRNIGDLARRELIGNRIGCSWNKEYYRSECAVFLKTKQNIK